MRPKKPAKQSKPIRRDKTSITQRRADRWARRLAESVRAVQARHPSADADNVRHTLILLELPPLERLGRSLLRAGGKANRK